VPRLLVACSRFYNFAAALSSLPPDGNRTMSNSEENSEKSSFEVAGVQMDVQLGDTAGNLAKMLVHVRDAASEGVHLVVFPECALTGYCFDSLEEAAPHGQSIPGPATDAVASVCQELNIYAMFGMLERADTGFFNACVLVGPDGVVGTYRKVHLPFLGIDRFTTPGDQPFRVYDIGGLRVGMIICYDGSFPESTRSMALDGADLVALPTNWPPGAETMAAYASNTRALENCIYFLAVDRIGEERGFNFIGGSRLCAPNGVTMDDAPHTNPQVLRGAIDVKRARTKRIVRVADKHIIDRVNDRRPEFYGRLVDEKDDDSSDDSSGEN
jgi:predicted amidohydrolase